MSAKSADAATTAQCRVPGHADSSKEALRAVGECKPKETWNAHSKRAARTIFKTRFNQFPRTCPLFASFMLRISA
jgi:hypothetical protein